MSLFWWSLLAHIETKCIAEQTRSLHFEVETSGLFNCVEKLCFSFVVTLFVITWDVVCLSFSNMCEKRNYNDYLINWIGHCLVFTHPYVVHVWLALFHKAQEKVWIMCCLLFSMWLELSCFKISTKAPLASSIWLFIRCVTRRLTRRDKIEFTRTRQDFSQYF